MQENPLVSVIIAARNEAGHIRQCLEAVLGQEGVREEFEVIVADGMSEDGTREIVEEIARCDGRVRLIDNPQRIVSTGLNEGIRQARGEIIARVDAHTIIADDYLARCLETLRRTGADNVGGPWRAAPAQGLCAACIAVAFQHPFAVGGARCHELFYLGPVDTVYLGFWPRRVFDEIGMFDEELVRNQDDEFNLRMTRHGMRIWQSPMIRCSYLARSTLGGLWRQYFQYGFWKIRVMQKHKAPASIRHLIPMLFVFALVAGLPLSFLHSALAWIYGSVVSLYLLAVTGASVHVALQRGGRMMLLLPAVFMTYHLAYGLGSLWGAVHFLVLRRSEREAGRRFTGLTR